MSPSDSLECVGRDEKFYRKKNILHLSLLYGPAGLELWNYGFIPLIKNSFHLFWENNE